MGLPVPPNFEDIAGSVAVIEEHSTPRGPHTIMLSGHSVIELPSEQPSAIYIYV